MKAGEPRHVFLISIDTLRADHCGYLGYSKPTTPFLDELAEQGVAFTNHHSNSNNTLISHVSILTGLLPEAHGTYDGGNRRGRRRLTDGYETIAERFARAGYTTAGFTTHPAWLGTTFGIQQGFDHYESDWRGASDNTRLFLRWVDREQPARLFAFLHYYDPHSESPSRGTLPYDSTHELIEQFAGAAPEGFTGHVRGRPDQTCTKFLFALDRGEEPATPEIVTYMRGLYDAGVRKMDDDLRALFTGLRRRGLLEDALVVITSDHGEEFHEHGGMLHGGWHEEVQRVPLVFWMPFLAEPRVDRLDAITRSIDVAPTILDLAGLTPIGQGRSSRAAMLGRETLADGAVVFGNSILRGRDEVSAYKYYGEDQPLAFYDMDGDPLETSNLIEDQSWMAASSQRLSAIKSELDSIRATAREIANTVRASDVLGNVEMDPHQAEELRRLGYVQ